MMLNKIFRVAVPGVFLLLTACGGGGGGSGSSPDNTVTLSSISVTPPTANVAAGLTAAFTATGTYSDATTANISSTVTWVAANTAIATVSSSGVATGVATGTTTITAALAGVTSASVSLAVSPAAVLSSINVTPATVSVATGLTTALTATGTYSDATTADITSTVTWTPANPAVATVSATGIVTGVTVGSTIITAELGGVTSPTANITVTVAVISSITVTPGTANVTAGLTTPFTAIGTYSDASMVDISSTVTWTPANPAVATVSATGLATGIVAGSTTITASLGGITSAAVSLTVDPAVLSSIAVTPGTANVAVGLTTAFTATGTYSDASTADISDSVTWTPANPAVATVSATGLATGVAAGSTTITASLSGITSAIVTLTVNPTSPVQMGGSIQGIPLSLGSGIVTTFAGSGLTGAVDAQGLAASFNSPSGITSDGFNLYVADNRIIRKIVIATSEVSTFAGSGAFTSSVDGIGTAASFYGASGITTDGTNLYVAESSSNNIRKIVIATRAVTTLAGTGVAGSLDGTGTAASFRSPFGITTDGTNLYVADTNNNKIRQVVITTGVVTTLAGSGAAGATDATSTVASFDKPRGITTDGTNLYVADWNNDKIRQVVIATAVVSTVAGSGFIGAADGIGAAASFKSPAGITSDGTNLYVADEYNRTVRQIVIATSEVTTLAGSAGTIGAEDGTGTAASFWNPQSITTDGTNLFVADTFNKTIRKISGTSSTPLLGGTIQGTPLSLGSGIVSTFVGAGLFNNTSNVTTDGTNLYVADLGNQRIRQVVIATGDVTTLAGSGVAGFVDGIGGGASFTDPNGVTTDGINVYVSDSGNHSIRQIVIATGAVTTLAGNGALGAADGIGAGASFNWPHGITTDGTNLYVSDSGNDSIRQIEIATGTVTTLAGGTSGAADGIGAAASFNLPYGITTDGSNLYVADYVNYAIRQIEIATATVTTLAGSGSAGATDGVGSAASFNLPHGITTDGTSLYVADLSNHTIRQIEIATATVTTLAGNGTQALVDGPAATASFNSPRSITSDGTSLYVVEGTSSVRKIGPYILGGAVQGTPLALTGTVSTFTGSGAIGSFDGTGIAATFNLPTGITSDGVNLYVSDQTNNKIRQIEIATGTVTTLAGSGAFGAADNSVGTLATFDSPFAITTDGTNLYVADTYNHRIRQVVIATGAVTTLAGSGLNGFADGTGLSSSFSQPGGITTDGTNLYVVDTSNRRIRQIVIATRVVTTLAGSGFSGAQDGTGTAATFNSPFGITTDGTNLYVADAGSNTIRKIVITTAEVSTLAGSSFVPAGSIDAVGGGATFNGPMGITSDGINLYVADILSQKIRQIVIATATVTSLAGSTGTVGAADGVGTAALFNNPLSVTSDGSSLYVVDSNNNKIRQIQ